MFAMLRRRLDWIGIRMGALLNHFRRTQLICPWYTAKITRATPERIEIFIKYVRKKPPLTEHINRVGGHDILGKLVVDAVTVDDEGAPVRLHDGRYIRCSYPSTLGADHRPGCDVLQRFVAHHPPDLCTWIRRCCGARQRHRIPDTCLRRT